MCNSATLSTFPLLCNHHHGQAPELSPTPNWNCPHQTQHNDFEILHGGLFLNSLFCSSHLSVSMPKYFYYYSSAVCLLWQGEPLMCFSFSDLSSLWTSVFPYTFWNACQVLKKVLEMWLALRWMCSLILESYLWTWLSSHLLKMTFNRV